MPTFSIRKTVPLAILVPLLTCVGIIGWVSFYSGQKTVKNLSSRLSEAAGSKVKERLIHFLEVPHQINQSNASAIALNQLSWQDPALMGRYYRAQISLFPNIDVIQFGYEQSGDLRGIFRSFDNTLGIDIRSEATGGALISYELGSNDKIGKQLHRSQGYDARRRDWYETAVKAGKAVWTKPSLKKTTKQLRISAVQPILEPNTDRLMGVQAVEFFLDNISEFLKSFKVSHSGQIFIVERSGELIASSGQESILQDKDNTTLRIKAIESKDQVIHSTIQAVSQQSQDLNQIQNTQELRFFSKGEAQLAYITPFKDEFGLDWLVFVVIPEKDFMQDLQRTAYLTLATGLAALFGSILLGLFATRWLVRPILQLNAAAIDVKNQTFDVNSIADLIRRPDELGQLAKVFEEMAQVILAREQSLADQVEQLREETDNAKKAAIATQGGMNLQVLLMRSQQVRQLVEHGRKENK